MTKTHAHRGEEQRRLDDDGRRSANWKRWGPYLAERQWGTVREDYSASGDAWNYLLHDHARSRAYRWGEDGLLGITDRECRLCFALALWNGRDPILKERLFGLSGPEGNHGEDVKELYYYLDATPSSSWLRALYKYPQAAFPYTALVDENRQRGRSRPEFEIEDSGVFAENRYFDVFAEYAKASPDDILIRIVVANRGPDEAPLHVVPTMWLRNTWAWGRAGEGYWPKGSISADGSGFLTADHPSLGRFRLAYAQVDDQPPKVLFTDNETNAERLFSAPSRSRWTKDAFHRHIIEGDQGAVNPDQTGTKAGLWWSLTVPAGAERVIRLRLTAEAETTDQPFDEAFEAVIERRREEAGAFYDERRSSGLDAEERLIARQADAGLLWSRQYYQYEVEPWLDGDPTQPTPPAERLVGRNSQWRQVHARDVLSVPDKWEYPWFAAWDLAFHCVALARIDPAWAKRQILLLGREWYMSPLGQFPAYEFAFDDANPPVQAWAAWRVYQLAAGAGAGKDHTFLASAFQKCLVNFTWWVNRKDRDGDNLFTGGFLGLDNVGVFDRSQPLPGGGRLEEADATAWMAFYCTTMMAIALELAQQDPAYADIASMFLEHFIAIVEAMNTIGGRGLWNEEDGFYYDHALVDGTMVPLRVRSMVGLIPLFAAEAIEEEKLVKVPGFWRRWKWFSENKPKLAANLVQLPSQEKREHRLLAVAAKERLQRVLRYVLDESELLSPYGIRSLSKAHGEHPYSVQLGGEVHEIHYAPGESDTGAFGGNSNWRGPVWFPVNYLLIEGLKRHHHFYGNSLRVECPVGSGQQLTLLEVAEELERRLAALFRRDARGRRPCNGDDPRYAEDVHFKDLVLFYEYFHGETGRGLGASHQTGWTALAANVFERVAAVRNRSGSTRSPG